jgi:transcriptional regulator with XRE-family HTH domain
MSIGMNIRKYRKTRGLTQVELAEKLGLSQVAVANYERGVRKPDVEMVPKIAHALGTSIEALFGLEGKKRLEPIVHLHKNRRAAKVQDLFENLRPMEQQMILKQMKGLIAQH